MFKVIDTPLNVAGGGAVVAAGHDANQKPYLAIHLHERVEIASAGIAPTECPVWRGDGAAL